MFCFAGQGAQYYGMAAQLMADEPVFRHWMEAGDALVADRHGFSVLEAIYGGLHRPSQPFDRLEETHPALFLVQYALAKTVQHHGLRPDALLGVSLGEIVAQSVAGMIPFETALAAVADQPAQFRAACPPGGMVAVLASSALYDESPLLQSLSEVAGVTSHTHFVLSAPAEALEAVTAELRRREILFQPLPVPYPFHSRFIDPVEESCRAATAGLRRESAFWPVWSCCTGTPTGPASPDLVWRIVRQPMNVQTTLGELEARGGAVYVDLSPSGTLAALFRQTLTKGSPSRLFSVLSPFGGDGERLHKTLAALRHLAA
jgi:acyl transferase domain-containing protein